MSLASLLSLLHGSSADCLSLRRIWKSHVDNPLEDADGEGDVPSWEAEFSQFASGDVASAYEELEADQARRYQEEMEDDVLGTTDETGFPRLGEYTFGELRLNSSILTLSAVFSQLTSPMHVFLQRNPTPTSPLRLRSHKPTR